MLRDDLFESRSVFEANRFEIRRGRTKICPVQKAMCLGGGRGSGNGRTYRWRTVRLWCRINPYATADFRDRNKRNNTPFRHQIHSGIGSVYREVINPTGRMGMVVFSGITSAGTQGAAEFFASAHSLRHLRSIFAREGINGFPPAYQVVVKCTCNNMLLVSYEYRLHKVLQRE